MGYWDNICRLQAKQTAKGIETYGQTLEQNKALSQEERLTYLEEELIDALMYIEHIKAGLNKAETYKNKLFDIELALDEKTAEKNLDAIRCLHYDTVDWFMREGIMDEYYEHFVRRLKKGREPELDLT